VSESLKSAPSAAERLPMRGGTIVWGSVLVVIALIGATASFLDPADYTPAFYIWAVVILGGVLVLAGVIGAIVRSAMRRPARVDEDAGVAGAGDVAAADDDPATGTGIFTTRQ
jgi:hypothetical protein